MAKAIKGSKTAVKARKPTLSPVTGKPLLTFTFDMAVKVGREAILGAVKEARAIADSIVTLANKGEVGKAAMALYGYMAAGKLAALKVPYGTDSDGEVVYANSLSQIVAVSLNLKRDVKDAQNKVIGQKYTTAATAEHGPIVRNTLMGLSRAAGTWAHNHGYKVPRKAGSRRAVAATVESDGTAAGSGDRIVLFTRGGDGQKQVVSTTLTGAFLSEKEGPAKVADVLISKVGAIHARAVAEAIMLRVAKAGRKVA